MKKTLKMPGNKTLEKGRADFRRNVTLWGIEGGAIENCAVHPNILIRSEAGPQGGYDVIEGAWVKGFISSTAEAGTDLLDKILSELPETCPECN